MNESPRPPYLDYLDPATLPWDYQELVRIVGLEKTLEIAARCGGTPIYMEQIDTILMPAKKAYILACHAAATPENPFNARKVARDADVCMDTVYEVLRKRNGKTIDQSAWQQESLLD